MNVLANVREHISNPYADKHTPTVFPPYRKWPAYLQPYVKRTTPGLTNNCIPCPRPPNRRSEMWSRALMYDRDLRAAVSGQPGSSWFLFRTACLTFHGNSPSSRKRASMTCPQTPGRTETDTSGTCPHTCRRARQRHENT